MNPPHLFLGESLALDLLNTRRGAGGGVEDALAAPHGAAAWARDAGILADGELSRLLASPPHARGFQDEILRLRDGLVVLVDAFSRGTVLPEEGVFALNRVLATGGGGVRLVADGPSARLERTRAPQGALETLLPVADAAARLLLEGDRDRLRRCDAPDCGLWFLDVSRNGRRRWCSMARCGNRAKVAAHHRRQRSGSGRPDPTAAP